MKHVTLNLGDKRQVDTTFCIIQPVLLVSKVRFIASCGFHGYCQLPNHISRVSKPVLDGTTWMGWGHTQSTDSPPASAASTWFPLHCCFFLLRCLFLCFFLREGTSPIYGQHGHHSFDSSLPSSSNHIGQGRKL